MTLFSFSGDKAISSDARATITQNAGSDRNNSSIYLDAFLVVFGAAFLAASAASASRFFSCLALGLVNVVTCFVMVVSLWVVVWLIKLSVRHHCTYVLL